MLGTTRTCQPLVLGVPWPGYRNFPEINLRFYVRRGDERGVVFVREFVPQRLVAWLARVFYNEPYRAATMSTGRHDGRPASGRASSATRDRRRAAGRPAIALLRFVRSIDAIAFRA